MSLSKEVKVQLDNKDHIIKFKAITVKRSMEELGIEGLGVLFESIAQVNFDTIYTLLRNGIDTKLSTEQLMECDINLTEVVESISQALMQGLGMDKKSKKK